MKRNGSLKHNTYDCLGSLSLCTYVFDTCFCCHSSVADFTHADTPGRFFLGVDVYCVGFSVRIVIRMFVVFWFHSPIRREMAEAAPLSFQSWRLSRLSSARYLGVHAKASERRNCGVGQISIGPEICHHLGRADQVKFCSHGWCTMDELADLPITLATY